MTSQGKLAIALTQQAAGFTSRIESTRPIHAAQIFTGKSVTDTLKIIPLLFNICGKAQAVTAVTAIESAINAQVDSAIESQREALVTMESLREHSLRMLIDWPNYINEQTNHHDLSQLVQNLNKLSQLLEPSQVVCINPQTKPISTEAIELWHICQQQLEMIIYAMPLDDWQAFDDVAIVQWAQQGNTQAARFIAWLFEQRWKYAGNSDIELLPQISDSDFMTNLSADKFAFVAQPHWQSSCYELSWFNYQQNAPIIASLTQKIGNGIYTRMIARLNEVGDLIKKLNAFFQQQTILKALSSKIVGLAHTNAARGRLSHYVEVENESIKQLIIIAPTEWNFHPHGVAADSLCHLKSDEIDVLRLQADLMIHAIDPCVEYQLTIDKVTH